MKLFAMFDELVYVVENIFVEGRREKTAIAKGPVTEFGASLTPSHDFAAIEMMRGFLEKLLFAI